MMTLQRLHFDPRHFHGNSPRRSPNLFAWDTLGHQISSNFPPTNNWGSCPSGDRFSVAEMVNRRMTDQNQITPRQIRGLDRTAWILVKERVNQDMLARLIDQFVGRDP